MPTYMASSASGQDGPNRALWLATRAGKMPARDYPLYPARKTLRKPYNKSFIDQVCSVKMAGYSSRSINMQKKNLANIQPSWPHTWPITHISCSMLWRCRYARNYAGIMCSTLHAVFHRRISFKWLPNPTYKFVKASFLYIWLIHLCFVKWPNISLPLSSRVVCSHRLRRWGGVWGAVIPGGGWRNRRCCCSSQKEDEREVHFV